MFENKKILRRLLSHDLRCGFSSWKMLCVPFLFLLPLVECKRISEDLSIIYEQICVPSVFDYWAGIYTGIKILPVDLYRESLQIPFVWLMTIGGSMWISVDYYLSDLSEGGYQYLLRSESRVKWILSKYLWTLLLCFVYYALSVLMALLFFFAGGRGAQLEHIWQPGMVSGVMLETDSSLTIRTGELIVLFMCPLLTICAVNIIQMTMCLFLKPILAVITSFGYLVLSVYCPTPLFSGNGAMIIRSSIIRDGAISSTGIAIVDLIFIVLFITAGIMRFRSYDLIRGKE